VTRSTYCSCKAGWWNIILKIDARNLGNYFFKTKNCMVKKRILAKISILAFAKTYFSEKNKYLVKKC